MSDITGPPTELAWCTVTPMPYMDDLFVRLDAADDVRLQVFFLEHASANYPLTDVVGRGYRSTVLKGARNLLALYWAAVSKRDTRWIVVGWGAPRYVALLIILAALGKPFWLFTDAPVPQGRTPAVWKKQVRIALLRFWFSRSRGVLGTGSMAVSGLIEMGAPSAKVVSLPYPLDEGRFEVGKNYDAEGLDEVIVVCSGRLSIADKRFDLAIEAFAAASARSQGRRTKLIIAGAGPDLHVLQRAAAGTGAASSVEFVGWLSQPQLRELYGRGHIYLHPTDFEPYGVTVVEALYSGLYTIASDRVGAAVELLVPGVNGDLFPVGDNESLASVLTEALDAVGRGEVRKVEVREASLKWEMTAYIDRVMDIVS